MADTPTPKGFKGFRWITVGELIAGPSRKAIEFDPVLGRYLVIDDSPLEPPPELTAVRGATFKFHQRIEAEVRLLMDGGIDLSRMSLRHGHVCGLPATWLAIDGTDVAQFTIRFVPEPTESDPT